MYLNMRKKYKTAKITFNNIKKLGVKEFNLKKSMPCLK